MQKIFLSVFYAFYLFCISGSEGSIYKLQVSPPNSNGSFCPGNIELTCIGREARIALNWFINESLVSQYLYDMTDIFPVNVMEYPVNITILNANGTLNIDIVSTLSSNFSYLRGASIQCGRGSILSNNIMIEGYSKLFGVKINMLNS